MQDEASTPASEQGSPVSPARQAFLATFGSVQGTPTSPARAKFLSAFGKLARLAQGTPSDDAGPATPAADPAAAAAVNGSATGIASSDEASPAVGNDGTDIAPSDEESCAAAAVSVAYSTSAAGSGATALGGASAVVPDDEQPSSDGPASADPETAVSEYPVRDSAPANPAEAAGAAGMVAPIGTASVLVATSADSAAGDDSLGSCSPDRSVAAAEAHAPAVAVLGSTAAMAETATARATKESGSSAEKAATVNSTTPRLASRTDATAFAAAEDRIKSAAAAASPETAAAAAPEAAGLGSTTDIGHAVASCSTTLTSPKEGISSPDVIDTSDSDVPALAMRSTAGAAVSAADPEGSTLSAEEVALMGMRLQSAAALAEDACISSIAASGASESSSLSAAVSGEAIAGVASPPDDTIASDDVGAMSVMAGNQARHASNRANTAPTSKSLGMAWSSYY